LAIYLVAELTDIIDGYVARHLCQKTRAGSILDPLADKLLFISAMVCLYKVGSDHAWAVQVPLWLVVAFVSRDVILLIGSFLVDVKVGFLEVRPNLWGKATAFLQAVCVISVLAQAQLPLFVWLAALAFTVISGIIYMKEGIKVLNGDHH
jgi:cardiolipin synthase